MPKRRLTVLDETPSTNTWLKENRDFHRPFTSVRAEKQTAGRGRLNRNWYSGAGSDLACSFVLPVPHGALHVAPLVAGMALYTLLSREASVKIKWPNDLLFHGKKLAGILCESIASADGLVIAGIGLNINSTEFPPAIALQTSSLALVTGRKFSVQRIWLLLYRELVRAFKKLSYPLPSAFIASYNEAAYRYVRRPEISDIPLEFKTLLADGRAAFMSIGQEIVLDTAE